MQLTVYFDFGSPYAYLAWQRIRHHPERYAGVEITWMPVSAGHIFKQDGTAPNVTMPNQKRYLLEDVKRWADKYGVPFDPPKGAGKMPVNAIAAMRMLCVAKRAGPDAARIWMKSIFEGYFQDSKDISDLAVLDDLAANHGLPQTSAIDEEAKQELISNTAQAYQAGAPGVPYMVLKRGDKTEFFWGNDRLQWIEAAIAGKPITV